MEQEKNYIKKINETYGERQFGVTWRENFKNNMLLYFTHSK